MAKHKKKSQSPYIKFTDKDKCLNNPTSITQYIGNEVLSQYLTFMCVDNKPNVTISLSNTKGMGESFGEVDINRSIRGDFHVAVNYDMILKYPKYVFPALFHELTHILDDFHYLSNPNFNKDKMSLKIYTEFHATIVELKKALNFAKVSDKPLITPQTQIQQRNIIVSLQDYYQSELEKWQTKVERYSKPLTARQFTNLKMYAYYYMAKIHFLRTYVQDYQNDMYDLSIFAEILGQEIQSMYNLLTTQEPSMELFSKLHKLDEEMSIRHMNAYNNI